MRSEEKNNKWKRKKHLRQFSTKLVAYIFAAFDRQQFDNKNS